jgi:hypothetical protein
MKSKGAGIASCSRPYSAKVFSPSLKGSLYLLLFAGKRDPEKAKVCWTRCLFAAKVFTRVVAASAVPHLIAACPSARPLFRFCSRWLSRLDTCVPTNKSPMPMAFVCAVQRTVRVQLFLIVWLFWRDFLLLNCGLICFWLVFEFVFDAGKIWNRISVKNGYKQVFTLCLKKFWELALNPYVLLL